MLAVVAALSLIAQPCYLYAGSAAAETSHARLSSNSVVKLEWFQDTVTARILGISAFTTIGSFSALDSERTGNWDQEIIQSEQLHLVRTLPIAGGFRRLVISEFAEGFEDRIIYEWSDLRKNFAVRELQRVKSRILYLDQSPSTPADVSCASGVRGDASSLFDFSREIDKKTIADNIEPAAIGKSCEKIKKMIELGLPALSVKYPANGKRFKTCFDALVGDVKRSNSYAVIANGFQKGLGNSKIRCDAHHPGHQLAAITPGTHEISLSQDLTEKPLDQNFINKTLFHELVHGSGINDEKLTANIVNCCSENLDEMNPSCKNARSKIAEDAAVELKKHPQALSAMMMESRAPTDLTTFIAHASTGPDLSGDRVTEAEGGSIAGQTTPIDLNKPAEKAETPGIRQPVPPKAIAADPNIGTPPNLATRTMIGNSIEVAKASRRSQASASLPSHMVAADMDKPGAPEAVAEHAHTVIRTGIAAAKDAFKQVDFNKIAASTVGVPAAQAQETAASGPRHTNSARQAASVDADGNQIVFQTKVVGQNTDGTPKIQLPDGTLLPSFKAFGNVESASPAPQAAVAAPQAASNTRAAVPAPSQSRSSALSSSSNSGSASSVSPTYHPSAGSPSVTADTVASQTAPTARSFASTSGPRGDAHSSGGGGGGSSGPSFGGSSGGGGGGRTPGSVPRAASTGDHKVLSLSQLKPHSHSMSDLQNVHVDSWSDVKTLIRSASTPQQLIKQQWFIDQLQRQDIRAQVIDHGVGYGSSDPLVRYDLKFLSNP